MNYDIQPIAPEIPTEYSEHARFVLHEIGRRLGIPRYLLAEPIPQFVSYRTYWEIGEGRFISSPPFDFQPAVIRQQPAVKMANRSLPNPNGEKQL